MDEDLKASLRRLGYPTDPEKLRQMWKDPAAVQELREERDSARLCNDQALAERDQYRAALIECATVAGADVSDGVPTWPDVATWAVQEVKQLREDYDAEPFPEAEPRSLLRKRAAQTGTCPICSQEVK